jgi:hypothetical protein
MTHPIGTVTRGLELAAEGHNATEVARLLDVPRATVRDWMYGRVPRRTRIRALGGCQVCGDLHDFGALRHEYAYLLGMYLGDGCLSAHRRDVFKLRISLDARYPEIVDECRDAIRAVMPRSRVNRVDKRTWFELYSYSKGWPCLFPQHGPGKKHERPIVLTPGSARSWRSVPTFSSGDSCTRTGAGSRTPAVAAGPIRGTPSRTRHPASGPSSVRPARFWACAGRRPARGRSTCRARTTSPCSTCSSVRSADYRPRFSGVPNT